MNNEKFNRKERKEKLYNKCKMQNVKHDFIEEVYFQCE